MFTQVLLHKKCAAMTWHNRTMLWLVKYLPLASTRCSALGWPERIWETKDYRSKICFHVIEEPNVPRHAHMYSCSLGAMSTVQAELKQAHSRDLPSVQSFPLSPCGQARSWFTIIHCSVELGPGFAIFNPSWLGPPKPWAESLLKPGLISLGSTPASTQSNNGNSKRGFSDTSCFPGIAASLSACASVIPWISARCTTLGIS